MEFSASNQPLLENHLVFALQVTKRRVKSVSILMALLAWSAATVLLVVMFVVGDHWLPGGMPDGLAWTVRGLYLLAALAWLVGAIAIPLLRRIHDLYAARLIERSHPEFRNTLVDAVQLASHEELPGSMRIAILGRASGEVAQVDVLGSVSTRKLRKILWANAAVLAAFLAYAAWAPKSAWSSVARAFGMHVPPPSWTVVEEVLPGDGTSVLRGEAVRFTVKLGGRAPASAFVRFSQDSGATWIDGQQLSLRSSGEGRGRLWQAVKAGQDVQRSMIWQVVAGDGSSPLRRLEVRELPEIASVRVRLDYPSYTRMAPTTQPGADIDAVAGTRATVTAVAKVPPRDPILVIGVPPHEHRRILAAPSAKAPDEITAQFMVESDDTYHLEFRDTHGQSARDPIHWTIHARPDLPPTVEVSRPREQVEAFANDVIEVTARAADDFGLTRAALVYHRPGDTQREEVPVSPPVRRDDTSAEIRAKLDLSTMKVAPGEVVEWCVSAWDDREDSDGKPAYQRTDSEARRVVIRKSETLAAADPKKASKSDQAGLSASAAASQPAESTSASASSSKESEPSPEGQTGSSMAKPRQESSAAESSSDDAAEMEGNKDSQSAAGKTAQNGGTRAQSVEQFEKAHARELRKLAEHFRQETTPSTENQASSSRQVRSTTRPSTAGSQHSEAESSPATQPGTMADSSAASETGGDSNDAADGSASSGQDANQSQPPSTQPTDARSSAKRDNASGGTKPSVPQSDRRGSRSNQAPDSAEPEETATGSSAEEPAIGASKSPATRPSRSSGASIQAQAAATQPGDATASSGHDQPAGESSESGTEPDPSNRGTKQAQRAATQPGDAHNPADRGQPFNDAATQAEPLVSNRDLSPSQEPASQPGEGRGSSGDRRAPGARTAAVPRPAPSSQDRNLAPGSTAQKGDDPAEPRGDSGRDASESAKADRATQPASPHDQESTGPQHSSSPEPSPDRAARVDRTQGSQQASQPAPTPAQTGAQTGETGDHPAEASNQRSPSAARQPAEQTPGPAPSSAPPDSEHASDAQISPSTQPAPEQGRQDENDDEGQGSGRSSEGAGRSGGSSSRSESRESPKSGQGPSSASHPAESSQQGHGQSQAAQGATGQGQQSPAHSSSPGQGQGATSGQGAPGGKAAQDTAQSQGMTGNPDGTGGQGQKGGSGQEPGKSPGSGSGEGQAKTTGSSSPKASGQNPGGEGDQGKAGHSPDAATPAQDANAKPTQGGSQGEAKGQGQNPESKPGEKSPGQTQAGPQPQEGTNQGKGPAEGKGHEQNQGEGQGGGSKKSEGQTAPSPQPQQESPGGEPSQAKGEGQGQGQEGSKPQERAPQDSPDSLGKATSSGASSGSGAKSKGGQGGITKAGPMQSLPEKPADADAPIHAPPSPTSTDPELQSVGRLDPLMDALDRELRHGELDEALLTELGWTLPQARQFVESYKRLKTGGQTQANQTRLPTRNETTDSIGKKENRVLRSEGIGAPSARMLNATHQRAADSTRELLEVGHQKVTPRYRSLLQAYYQSLATQPAEASPRK